MSTYRHQAHRICLRQALPGFAATVLLLASVGCSQSPKIASPSPFLVPSAAVVHYPYYRETATASSPNHLLPLIADDEAYIPRDERYAIAPNGIVEASSFTDYTYEAQPIGLPGGYGFRYRYVVRQGFSSP